MGFGWVSVFVSKGDLLLDERTEMIVEVDGIEEIRRIASIYRPSRLGDMSGPYVIKVPMLREGEEIVEVLSDKVIICRKWR